MNNLDFLHFLATIMSGYGIAYMVKYIADKKKNLTPRVDKNLKPNFIPFVAIILGISMLSGSFFQVFKVYKFGHVETLEISECSSKERDAGRFGSRTEYFFQIKNSETKKYIPYTQFKKLKKGMRIPVHVFRIDDKIKYYIYTGQKEKNIWDFLKTNNLIFFSLVPLIFILLFFIFIGFYYFDNIKNTLKVFKIIAPKPRSWITPFYLFESFLPLIFGILITLTINKGFFKVVSEIETLGLIIVGVYLIFTILFTLLIPMAIQRVLSFYQKEKDRSLKKIKIVFGSYLAINSIYSFIDFILDKGEDKSSFGNIFIYLFSKIGDFFN